MAQYALEITQMLTLFGDSVLPDEDTIKYTEDLVRGHLTHVVIKARSIALHRHLQAEDFLFLLRKDTSASYRLKSYLSWREVRRKAVESDGGPETRDGTNNPPEGNEEDDVYSGSGEYSRSTRPRRFKIKCPWDLDVALTGIDTSTSVLLPRSDVVGDAGIEEEEDEVFHEEPDKGTRLLMQYLDEHTRDMPRDEYLAWADNRAASFSCRKAKWFRDFINFPSLLDYSPSDEVIECLSFMGYEYLRNVCAKSLRAKQTMELLNPCAPSASKKRKRTPGNLDTSTSLPQSGASSPRLAPRAGSATPTPASAKKASSALDYASLMALDETAFETEDPTGPFSYPDAEMTEDTSGPGQNVTRSIDHAPAVVAAALLSQGRHAAPLESMTMSTAYNKRARAETPLMVDHMSEGWRRQDVVDKTRQRSYGLGHFRRFQKC